MSAHGHAPEAINGAAGSRAYRTFINPRWARVLRLIGCERTWVRGERVWLEDTEGGRVLDAIGGYGAATVGHHHPHVARSLHDAIEGGAPGMIHFGVPPRAGHLAERLLEIAPRSLTRVFFTNSGTEGIELAIKMARASTGRDRLLACDHAFHGFSTGSLSLCGHEPYREGFGTLLPSHRVPFGDLAALEQALAPRDVAGFVIEPIQGKGVYIPTADYLAEAQRLCHRAGSLCIVDEVQTGFGRCGSLFASQADGAIEPDIMVVSKALSGGMIPVGAVLASERAWGAVFSSLDRAMVHGSTFHQAPLAMAAAHAVLDVIDGERLVERSAHLGERLRTQLEALRSHHRTLGAVRGRGLMVALDLVPPRPLRSRLEHMLWPQAFVMALLDEGGVLAQVVNQRSATIKFTPPLVIDDREVTLIVQAVDRALARVDGGALETTLGTLGRMAMNLMRSRP
ncbi:MAG: aspartate aminotransferase family protein [Phycisphaeraceae bacterium]|nr:aspartate aminotransferase family protein [Phycisphaeraceae bacterium]